MVTPIMRFTSIIAVAESVFLLRAHTSSAAQIPSSRVPEGLGVNIHFDQPLPGELKMMLAAGFRIMRTDILWDQSELKRGQYDFSLWDELFAQYRKHNVLGNVATAAAFRNDAAIEPR